MDRGAARQRCAGGPERIVRCGDQHLVAVVQQRLQCHLDEFGGAIAEVDVVDVEPGKAVDKFIASKNGPAGGLDALGIRVALRVRQRLDHVAHDHVGRLEAEWRRVADVQLENAVSLGLQPSRMLVHGTTNLVQDVLKLRRLRERALPRVVARRVPRHLVGSHVHHRLIDGKSNSPIDTGL